MKMRTCSIVLLVTAIAMVASQVKSESSLTTTFTYQGQLKETGQPAQGQYDVRFYLYNAAMGGSQLGETVFFDDKNVTNGLFTVLLDFGDVFDGTALWLEIWVRPGNSTGDYTFLSPRQPLTATPYALYAINPPEAQGDGNTLDQAYDQGDSGAGRTITADSGAVEILGPDGLTVAGAIQSGDSLIIDGSVNAIISDADLELQVNSGRILRVESNATSPNLIGGFSGNSVTDFGHAVGGGGNSTEPHTITSGAYCTIGGGSGNCIDNASSVTIGGGRGNQVQASGDRGTIGGGYNNTVSGGSNATVAGGKANTASERGATVCGGEDNRASGQSATVCGGDDNIASGEYSFVAGGAYNTAAGAHSFAAGEDAEALHEGTFVWSDSQSGDEPASTGPYQWVARASGGVWFYTNVAMTAGARLPAGGGAWQSVCDRDLKDNFDSIDAIEVLDRLTAIPIETWNYKSQDASIRHIGPMAQDFYSAFSVGEDNRHITTIDADGVALAAIQGLRRLIEEKDIEIATQCEELSIQGERISDLIVRLERLEAAMAELAKIKKEGV